MVHTFYIWQLKHLFCFISFQFSQKLRYALRWKITSCMKDFCSLYYCLCMCYLSGRAWAPIYSLKQWACNVLTVHGLADELDDFYDFTPEDYYRLMSDKLGGNLIFQVFKYAILFKIFLQIMKKAYRMSPQSHFWEFKLKWHMFRNTHTCFLCPGNTNSPIPNTEDP